MMKTILKALWKRMVFGNPNKPDFMPYGYLDNVERLEEYEAFTWQNNQSCVVKNSEAFARDGFWEMIAEKPKAKMFSITGGKRANG